MKDRPLGLSIISILVGIEAIFQILLSLAFFGLSVAGVFSITYAGPALVMLILGLIVLVVGIVELGVSMGLWSGERWAWTVTVIVVWIDIVFDVIGGFVGTQSFTSTMLSMIIPLIVLIYMYQGGIRKLFDK